MDMIVQFVRGMDLGAFREDPTTVPAAERKLLLISEAATRLGEDAERLCPGLPWRNIRGIGNWLRHRYDRVDVETVWNTVTDDLPPLKSGVLRALTPPPVKPQGAG
ncbi:MAG TPA: HepT-like ribonuclease domain-containing protein [Bryobacteraceae bacterium]